VDLSMWIMQADQQASLAPHFSREERAIKVAFERAIQWIRHGCLPVVVIEGKPPEEKRGVQRQRFANRNGYFGGGGASGAASFTRLGCIVGEVLAAMGIPVFHAPGEAEATCAALCAAGCVDAVASFDSDALLHGAERVYHTLKLSVRARESCSFSSLHGIYIDFTFCYFSSALRS
jgi:flap endonuclease GEN